jgi:hypothetical protein
MMFAILHIFAALANPEPPMRLACLIAPAVLAVSLFAASALPALAQPAPAPAPAPPGRSANLQGEDPRKFIDNPQMRAFYALSVETLRPGAPPLDLKAYEAKAFALFHAFGEARAPGGGPGMVDHLKLIPGQVVKIVRDDPKVLDSFEAFADAMVGPE